MIAWRTRSAGLAAGFNKTHIGERAEPHVAGAVIQPKAVDPGSRTAWPDLQIQTGAVVVQSDLGERADFCFGELLDEASHKIPFVGNPLSTASIRLMREITTVFRAIWTLWKGILQIVFPAK